MKQLTIIDGLVELAQKAKADSEEWVVKSLLSIALTGSQSLIKAVTTKLAIPAFIETIAPLPFDSSIHSELNPQYFRDHVLLGKIKGTNSPFWYPIPDLTKHLLMLGKTGSGKTNLLYLVIAQLLQRVAVWIFDYKQDFRHLVRMFPGKFLVFDLVKTFKCNPLCPPPGVHPKKWLGIVSDLFCRCNSLLEGSLGLLVGEIDKLYKKHGIYDGSEKYPSFYELYERLKNLPLNPRSRTEGYRESIINRLFAFLSINPDIYDCSKGYPLDELTNKNVIFELHGLLDNQARFWINLLLYWIFCYRIEKKQRGSGLLNLIVFDEAKNVYSPYTNPNIGFANISLITSLIREFGLGIAAADQAANLDSSIFANSFSKILFPLGDGADLKKAQASMSLSNEQIEYIHKLQIGEAIVRFPAYPKPFVLQIPRFPLG